jgi:hypothetical protein
MDRRFDVSLGWRSGVANPQPFENTGALVEDENTRRDQPVVALHTLFYGVTIVE